MDSLATGSSASALKQALFTIRDLREKLQDVQQPEPIAIVGLACRTPGAADPNAFWNLLINRRDAISEIPSDRWDADALYDPDGTMAGRLNTRWAGTIPADKFDAEFFGISAEEAAHMDPQQRIFLEVSWEALEDAGLTRKALAGSNSSVFVGALNYNADYSRALFSNPEAVSSHSGPGTAHSILAGRLSYLLDMRGPSISIDTACSSSLVAVHLAAQSLRTRESDLAVAGGINLILSPEFTMAACRMNLMSPDGRCKPFDERANGIVRSDGCGVVVLKRLSDAIANSDRVVGVIRGSAINQDGQTNGMTAPSGRAQQDVICKALAQAGIGASEISYIEAHGTGTILGDPIEIDALTQVFKMFDRNEPCFVGSSKANIGHCEAAAGVLGLIKIILAIKNQTIPPQIHLQSLNPHIDLDPALFHFPVEPVDWRVRTESRRIAGVSSFGWSGTNAHIIVEEPPVMASSVGGASDVTPDILLISAVDSEALHDRAAEFVSLLRDAKRSETISDICYTAAIRRTQHNVRRAFVGSNRGAIADSVEQWLKTGQSSRRTPRRLAFVFSGQGDQWPGMVDELLRSEPEFRRAMQQCDEVVRAYAGWSVLDAVQAGGTVDLSLTSIAQPCVASVQIALAELLKSWGVVPSGVVGHSVGEFASACCAGVLSVREALEAVVDRGRIMEQIRDSGSMVATLCPLDELNKVSSELGVDVDIAALNGPLGSVLAMDSQAVDDVLAKLEQRGIRAALVNPHYPFHSRKVDEIMEALAQRFESIAPNRSGIVIASSTEGGVVNGESMDGGYWVRNARQPVLFERAIESLVAQGFTDFIELGPNPALVQHVRQVVGRDNSDAIVMGSLRRGKSQRGELLAAAALLCNAGHDLNWGALFGHGRRPVELPAHPWKKQRHWMEVPGHSAEIIGINSRHTGNAGTGALRRDETWGAEARPFMGDHCMFERVVVPGAAHLAAIFSALEKRGNIESFALADVVFSRPLVLSRQDYRRVEIVIDSKAVNAEGAAFRVGLSSGGSDEHELLSSGVVIAEGGDLDQCPAISIEDFVANSGTERHAGDFYGDVLKAGLQLGPSFRGIVRLYVTGAGSESLAMLALPPEACTDGALAIQPGMLDSCFQSLFSCAWAIDSSTELFIPLSIERIAIFARFDGPIWCHAVRNSEFEPNDEVMRGDLRLYDQRGRLVGRIDQLCLKRAPRGSVLRHAETAVRIYEPEWIEEAVPHPAGLNPASSRWLVVSSETEQAELIARQLIAANCYAIVVRASDACQLIGTGMDNWTDVAFVAPQHEEQTGEQVVQELETAGAAVRIVKALVAATKQPTPKLWIVTSGTQGALAGEDISTSGSSLWGIGRTLRREHPDVLGRLIDLPFKPDATAVKDLVRELTSLAAGDDVALRANRRLVQKLRPRTLDSEDKLSSIIRPDRTYLITGGLGGIGRLVVRQLLERGARHLLIMGRSPPDAGFRREIEDWSAKGAVIRIRQGDVGREEDVHAALRLVKRSMPPLGGVMHAAGVASDAGILNVTDESMRNAFQAKVAGGWNLHRSTLDQDLDFFVLFSSLAGMLGTPGQASYAGANTFLDALAAQRHAQGMKAVAIAWGPVATVGMTARLGDDLRKGIAAQGVQLLDPADVIDGLCRVATSAAPNAIVADVTLDVITRLRASSRQPVVSSVPAPKRAATDAGDFASIMQIADHLEREDRILKLLTAEIRRKTGAVEVDVSGPLRSIGLDSLEAVSLVQMLRKKTGAPIPLTLFFDCNNLIQVAKRLSSLLDRAQKRAS